MSKVKISRKSTRIDMTAMCDVAFLLLSFFVMTATAKQPEPKPVDAPASTVQDKLPEDGVAVITVGEKQAFFTIPRAIRKETFKLVAAEKGLPVSDKELSDFERIDGFGMPLNKLQGWLKLSPAERSKPGVQEGIPYDSVNDQLSVWIKQARQANKEFLEKEIAEGKDVKFKDLDIAIKGDAKEQYTTVKSIIDILQKQKKNKFFLVTGLRGKDF
jgi:biopolymer transport protein ExbD|nr:biopolymer transporter ExbD [uncultured Flavobacterium sp.]